jgi:hypothetical protein
LRVQDTRGLTESKAVPTLTDRRLDERETGGNVGVQADGARSHEPDQAPPPPDNLYETMI